MHRHLSADIICFKMLPRGNIEEKCELRVKDGAYFFYYPLNLLQGAGKCSQTAYHLVCGMFMFCFLIYFGLQPQNTLFKQRLIVVKVMFENLKIKQDLPES